MTDIFVFVTIPVMQCDFVQVTAHDGVNLRKFAVKAIDEVIIQLYNCIIMNYVTTNIRIPEEDYLRLKEEAARERKSFSAVIREKIQSTGVRGETSEDLVKLIRKRAKANAKYLKDLDGVKIIREMRDNAKW